MRCLLRAYSSWGSESLDELTLEVAAGAALESALEAAVRMMAPGRYVGVHELDVHGRFRRWVALVEWRKGAMEVRWNPEVR